MNNGYNIYNSEQIGKVLNFDGEAGTIITDTGQYTFSKKDISNDNFLEKGDVVTFRINNITFGNEVMKLAKFVKKNKTLNYKIKK